MQPQHRSYSKSFKAQVIQECAQPGASIANIALSHSLNANLVHKWIRLQSQKSVALQPTFIPLTPQPPTSRLDITAATICLEIPPPRVTVKVSWPTESAAACETCFSGACYTAIVRAAVCCSWRAIAFVFVRQCSQCFGATWGHWRSLRNSLLRKSCGGRRTVSAGVTTAAVFTPVEGRLFVEALHD
ncbi:IS66-like element accessory protein TnpA [Pseudomonas sp. LS2P72]